MTLDVPILRAGVLARKFCRSISLANVEAVFARCFYLRCGDAFICVGEPDIGNGPLTLIGNIAPLSDLNFRVGQSAAVCERHITLGNSVRFKLDQTESWRSTAWPICMSPAKLVDTCAALARRVAADAPEEGLARLVSGVPETSKRQPPLERVARPRIVIFERWLSGVLDGRRTRVRAFEEAIQGLIGLGPGLTPSGDDFLVGALALLDAIGEREAHAALARAIIDALPGSTAPLSACFLRVAAAGHVGEALHRAVSSVTTGDVDAVIAAVENIGHSSGWDMMAGIMTTLRIVVAAQTAADSSSLRALVDPIRGIDRGPGRGLELVAPEHGLKRRQATQHIGLAANVAHRSEPPDLAGERPERGADFNAEIMKQLAADSFAVRDLLGDNHTGHVGHAVAGIAE
jgi:hypothetical protein